MVLALGAWMAFPAGADQSTAIGLVARNEQSDEAKCRRAEQRLEKIKERMRRGYRSREADRLHQRELKAREARRKHCG